MYRKMGPYSRQHVLLCVVWIIAHLCPSICLPSHPEHHHSSTQISPQHHHNLPHLDHHNLSNNTDSNENLSSVTELPKHEGHHHGSHSAKATPYKDHLSKEKSSYPLEDILALLLSLDPSEIKTANSSIHDVNDPVLEATLLHLIESLANQPHKKKESSETTKDKETTLSYSHTHNHPELQFLEPDLGPAVLPLQVPDGYFVPFVPRKAFGVTNGVARPPHGHASFYRYRPRGLVDVRNSPAFGYLLGGP